MDASNSGAPIPRHGQMPPNPNNQMRPPPPSPGSSSMDLNARPSYPVQRPPPPQQQQQQQQVQQQQPHYNQHQYQQLQPPLQGGPAGGRSPILSPFQRQDAGASGQQQPPVRPTQPTQQSLHQGTSNAVRPLGNITGPGQRSPLQQQQLPPPQQQQQQQRPSVPSTGHQAVQMPHTGRPVPGPANVGGRCQLLPSAGLATGAVSPQSQPQQPMRPPMQPGQQQQPISNAHQQPLMSGPNLRPSSSHPSLLGGGPGGQGNRFTPPSPNITTRSPQIRPLQHSPPNHGGQGNLSAHQQQQHNQQQPGLRPSSSQPHLSQQPGVRPPSTHGSPIQAQQPTAMRPPPMMQQQPRPRPQAASHGQGLPQQANSHQTVQPDMPLVDSRTNGEADPPGARQFSQQQLSQQSSQRPPGARPILDQLRQHNQQAQVSGQVAHGQAPHNMNPTQRQPQRPPAPLQGQLPRPQQPSNSSQHHAREAALAKDHSPSPPGRNVDVRTSNGDHGRPERQSPQQQPTFLPNQRPANPQQLSGPALGQHQQHSSPVGQTSPSRPYVVPGSPRQRPLEGAEIKAPGQITGTPSHQPPQAQQPPQKTQQHASQLPQQHASQLPQQHASQPEASTQLAELDAPLSDVEGDAFDEDDIKGGSVGAPKPHPAEFAVDGHAPQPTAAAGGPSAGPPPTGPPTGPPRGPPKNITVGRPGPARVISPLNNPSSPPESAFPQPRSRIRPPPNKEFTPYRPPERPSQAPIMYSQSGQPTFSQPFPQQDEKLSAGLVADKSSGPATTSTVPQGADATSSSIRPREGGLQKRVFASDNKTTKPEAVPGANLISPPSPKLHGRKGPAILNVSGQRSSFSSSSAVKMLKTWAIRGGLTYLGYTAIFNCPSDSTGVKGLYCKATNGVGGLAKPYVAPHYNAYVGPHVDRFVKPVARGGHHIYLKVANPVVQGALSAAGSVYRITAKKHVDSAKDQVISILPYPFKKPGMTGAASDKDSDKIPDEKQQQKDTHDKEQPAEKMQHIVESIENTVEAVKESVAEKLEEMVNSVQEEIAEVKNTVREQAAPIKEVVQQKEQEVENKVEEAVRQVEEQMKEQEQLAQEQEQEQEHEKEENEDEQKPHANGHRPSSDDENKVVESNGHEEGHGQLEKKSENSDDSDEHQHEDEKKVLDSSFMDKTAASKDSLKNVQDDGEQNGTGNYDQEQHGVSEEHKETVPTEDEQERQPSPEPAAAVEPNPTPEPTVINEEQQADAVAQEPPMTTPVEDAVESSADVPETETAEARPGFEDPETALFDGAEAAPDVTETSPKGFDEHKKPAEVEASAPVEEKDQNQLPVETEIQDHTEQIKEEPMREHQHEGEVDAEQGQQAALASLDATHDDNATKAHDEL